MASGMSIASNNLRHSSSMFILLRAVWICVALLMWMEVASEKAESKGAELKREWVSDGEHMEVYMRDFS